MPYLRQGSDCKLLDIGCGWERKLLRSVGLYIASGIGVDFKAPAEKFAKNHPHIFEQVKNLDSIKADKYLKSVSIIIQ